MGAQPRVAVTMTQCWHRVPGGVASSVTRLVAALDRSGSVRPVGVGPRSRRAPSPWAPTVEVASLSLPLPVLYDAWDLTGRPAVESATGPVDLVHVTIPISPRRADAPIVATVHDVFPLTRPDDFTGRGARLMRRGLHRLRTEATRVAVPTEHVARQCRALGFDAERLAVVPWGVDVAPVDDEQVVAVRRRHGLDGDYVLVVGTLEPRKGLDVLARAVARLDRPELTLAIAGPIGWGADPGDELAAVAGPVARLGFVPSEDLAPLRRGAAAVCSPSVAEGFGLPVLEALAAGAAVVTTSGTAMEEVAAGAAQLARPGDPESLAEALAAVLDDPGRSAELRSAGMRRAGELTWERSAAAMTEVYRAALADPR